MTLSFAESLEKWCLDLRHRVEFCTSLPRPGWGHLGQRISPWVLRLNYSKPEGELTGPQVPEKLHGHVPVVERDLKFPLAVRNKDSEAGKLRWGTEHL